MRLGNLLALLLLVVNPASHAADPADVKSLTLRLSGADVQLPDAVSARLAGTVREWVSSCGPNSLQHPQNFGPLAQETESRWHRMLGSSRLHVVYAQPFESVAWSGERLPVSEVLIGLADDEFLGPELTRSAGRAVSEHTKCGTVQALEFSCMPELFPYLPARYTRVCAFLKRDPAGHIIEPEADIAPSCS